MLSGLAVQQVVERLGDAQIANAEVNNMSDVWGHPQLKARDRWVQIETPAGPVPALLPPGVPRNFCPRMDAVPALGQHIEMILKELRYTDAQIARLGAEDAI